MTATPTTGKVLDDNHGQAGARLAAEPDTLAATTNAPGCAATHPLHHGTDPTVPWRTEISAEARATLAATLVRLAVARSPKIAEILAASESCRNE